MANKIIVCQIGSRHRYLIPKVLESSNLLYRLYTDSTVFSLCGKIAAFSRNFFHVPAFMQRLTNRVPAISKKKIYTTDVLLFKERLIEKFCKSSLKQYYTFYNGLSHKFISWGLGEADCIYSMYIENFDFLKYAKSKGLKVVVDIYEAPMTYKYLQKEIDENVEYSSLEYLKETYSYSHNVRMHYMEDLLKLADYYTVPSRFVVDSMSVFKNFNPSKVLYLPYASSIKTSEYAYKPVKHRLIWVGNDVVRKGLVYCAKAASILKKKYADLDFRIIGCVPEEIKQSEYFSDLNFLGVLNKPELQEEYRSAEAYVFPTLFEGFAGTVIEAASCGCPIITTECAGTDPDEFPAIYIPTHDVNSIVDAVTNIFEHSDVRDELSKKVYDYSSNLSPDTYKKNLIGYLKDI